jgi:hypothetical protein
MVGLRKRSIWQKEKEEEKRWKEKMRIFKKFIISFLFYYYLKNIIKIIVFIFRTKNPNFFN